MQNCRFQTLEGHSGTITANSLTTFPSFKTEKVHVPALLTPNPGHARRRKDFPSRSTSRVVRTTPSCFACTINVTFSFRGTSAVRCTNTVVPFSTSPSIFSRALKFSLGIFAFYLLAKHHIGQDGTRAMKVVIIYGLDRCGCWRGRQHRHQCYRADHAPEATQHSSLKPYPLDPDALLFILNTCLEVEHDSRHSTCTGSRSSAFSTHSQGGRHDLLQFGLTSRRLSLFPTPLDRADCGQE